MEPSPPPTQSLTFPPPTSSDLPQLSSIWQLLPVELVQQILDHLIENLLTCCRTSNINSTAENAAILENVWFNLRRDNLFNSQKSLIERHFLHHWLPGVSVWIYINRGNPSRFQSCNKYTALPDAQLTPSDDGDPESEKVTYSLALLHCTRRADLISTWEEFINARATEDFPLRVARRKVYHAGITSGSSTTRRMEHEDWEVLDDGDCIRLPWKKVMTMVLTYILDLWRRGGDDLDLYALDVVPKGLVEVFFDPGVGVNGDGDVVA